jgi:DNA polymerase-3 subunit alpha
MAADRESAQTSLFGLEEPAARPVLPDAQPWSAQERLDAERESVGFYLSGHPLSDFFAHAPSGRYLTVADLLETGESEPRLCAMAGVLRRVVTRPAQSGGQLAYVTFSDPTGEFEAMVMPEHLSAARELLQPGRALAFTTKVRWRDGDMRLAVSGFEPVEAAEARSGRSLTLVLSEGAELKALAAAFQELRAREGEEQTRPLKLLLQLRDGRKVELAPPGAYPAGPAARAALKSMRGVEQVL